MSRKERRLQMRHNSAYARGAVARIKARKVCSKTNLKPYICVC